MAEPINLRATATGPGRPLRHFWSTVVGAGRAMGAPSSPTREQTAALEAAARATRRESLVVPADGVLRVECSLAPRSFLLLRQVA